MVQVSSANKLRVAPIFEPFAEFMDYIHIADTKRPNMLRERFNSNYKNRDNNLPESKKTNLTHMALEDTVNDYIGFMACSNRNKIINIKRRIL